MSLLSQSWLHRAHCCQWASKTLAQTSSPLPRRGWRHYATHRDSPNLSESLDTHRLRTGKPGDSVGPFPLGSSSAFRGPRAKQWSELSVGGKVKRATARTSNLVVILVGAGLSAVLIYTLSTELYSSNSPTVLHQEACERIRKSAQVAKYLQGPLTFYNTPTSVERPRSRMGSHQVTSEVMVDSTGRHHMFLNLYIHGQVPGANPPSDSYYDAVTNWLEIKRSGLPEMNVDSISSWIRLNAHNTVERSREIFRYLTGAPLPPPVPTLTSSEEREEKKEGKAWQIAGIFSSLRTTTGSQAPPRGTGFTDGEVHAELVMNDQGKYVFRYLFVDIPSTQDPRHLRVWVERAKGIPEDQAPPRWSS